jgi:hypothetical protein
MLRGTIIAAVPAARRAAREARGGSGRAAFAVGNKARGGCGFAGSAFVDATAEGGVAIAVVEVATSCGRSDGLALAAERA